MRSEHWILAALQLCEVILTAFNCWLVSPGAPPEDTDPAKTESMKQTDCSNARANGPCSSGPDDAPQTPAASTLSLSTSSVCVPVQAGTKAGQEQLERRSGP